MKLVLMLLHRFIIFVACILSEFPIHLKKKMFELIRCFYVNPQLSAAPRGKIASKQTEGATRYSFNLFSLHPFD